MRSTITLTPSRALTKPHGLPERFRAHVLESVQPDGPRAWSFAPQRELDRTRPGIDAIETDLRSFEQRAVSLASTLVFDEDERPYECFATLVARTGSRPVIVLVAMTRHAGRPLNRPRAIRVALFDTATRRASELFSERLVRAKDRPVVEVFADHSAFCVRTKSSALRVFDANGAESTDPLVIDAFTARDDRCALTRTLRARLDGATVLIEDLDSGEQRRTEPLLASHHARPTLRALSATRVLLSRDPQREPALLIEVETLQVSELIRAGRVFAADDVGVVFGGGSDQPVTLYELATRRVRTLAVRGAQLVGVTKDRLVFVRDGRFETIARASGSVEDRQTSSMGPIAKIMVSDRGAVCVQDESQHFCWWNDAADQRFDSDAWAPDGARTAGGFRVVQWIDGQRTLVVARNHDGCTEIVGLGCSDTEAVERWALKVPFVHAIACDESGEIFAIESSASSRISLCKRDGASLVTVATSAPLARASKESIVLRLHDDHVIERASDDAITLFRPEGESLESVATSSARVDRSVAADVPVAIEQVPTLELSIGRLLPFAPRLPAFEQQPERRMLSAWVKPGDAATRDRERSRVSLKTLVFVPMNAFSALDQMTALAIAPNAQWGAIGTRRGLVLRFAIVPESAEPTHEAR